MSDNKKARSPQIGRMPFIRAMMTLRHEANRAPTVTEVTKFLNTHQYDEGSKEWTPNPEGTPNGVRNHLSISSRISQIRSELEDDLEGPDNKERLDNLLAIMEVTSDRSEKKRPESYDSIVMSIKSLNLLSAPANMIQGKSAVGTNGNPVGNEFVDE